jgi:cobalt-zinc-cadmium efflux system membrane fusion protein
MLRRLLHAIFTLAVFAALGLAFYAVGHDGRLPWQPPLQHGEDWCKTHGVPLSEDVVCNPKLARGGTMILREREPQKGECPNTLVRITLPEEVAKRAGIAMEAVEMRPVVESIKAPAETGYVPASHAKVGPRAQGVVREVRVGVGDTVEAAQVLALIDSQEVGGALAELRQASAVVGLREKTLAQEKELAEKRVGTGRDLLQAGTELEEAKLSVSAARQKLILLGLSAEEIDRLASTGAASTALEVRSPFAGVVLDVAAVLGEVVGPERTLFEIADPARMRIAIDVYEGDLAKLEKDQRVTFTIEGLPGQRFTGKVITVGGAVDERTRTLKVLADVKNPQGLLRAHMFGRAEIQVKPAEPKLLVPREAVQTDGDCYFVFVSPSSNVFRTRQVELGTPFQSAFEIRGGLAVGDKVVTTGSFMLKTEVLRGEMGAG